MKKTLIVLLMVLLSAMLIVSCDDNAGSSVMHKVTFDSDTGSEAVVKEVKDGEKVAKPDNPVKTGYTFVGWYNGENKFEFGTTTVTGNISLKAKWNINSYTVSFNPDGGTPASYDSRSVEYNNTIATAPTEPTKADYVFGGWYNGESKFEFGTTKITGNIELKAKWCTTYTVTFNNGDGTTTTQTVTEGNSATEPAKPAKSGWIFDHWATVADGTEAFDFNAAINENTTLYAVFRNYYKVGDTGPAGGIIIYDCDADNTEEDPDGQDNLISTGASACGWRYLEAAPTDAPSGNNAQQYTWGPDGNLGTGKAIGDGWKNAAIFMDEIGYPDSFPAAKACDEYSVSVGDVTYNDWFLPSKEEMTLVYNNKAKLGGLVNDEYSSSSEDIHDGQYIALWIMTSSGSWDMRTRTGAKYVRPVRAFLDASTPNPPAVSNPTPKYTVTFSLNDDADTTFTTVTVKDGKTVSKPATPTKDGYVFLKWTTDKEGNTVYDFTTAVTGNVKLYAQWMSGTVKMGEYSYDYAISSLRGKDISWKILYVDSDNSRMLVVSENVLENKVWNEFERGYYQMSEICRYLEQDFINDYKLNEEDNSNRILFVDVNGETANVGSGYQKVFLLSETEVNTYLPSAASKVATYDGQATSWWLRSKEMESVKYVNESGSIATASPDITLGLRPAMWITFTD